MWSLHLDELPPGSALGGWLERDGVRASVGEVLAGLADEPALRAALTTGLAGAPFSAFKWETPPVTAAELRLPFECALLDSPSLARRANPHGVSRQSRRA